MDKYIFDKSNGLWYELQGDYYIPCLILSEEETTAYRVMGCLLYTSKYEGVAYTCHIGRVVLRPYAGHIVPQVNNSFHFFKTSVIR